LSRHRFAQLATTVATEDNKHRVQELLGRVKHHQWSALSEYKGFQSDQNAVVVYSITGPHSGGMVALVRDPFELYEPADLYLLEQLSPDEVLVVTALISVGDWHDLSPDAAVRGNHARQCRK
jgi:hypothetical protein